MQVSARFYLQEVTRTPYYITKSGQEMVTEEATRVKLAPVKGEPFGPATPQGQIDMLIVNPAAGAVFQSAPINQEFDILITPVQRAE
jgi:hypothetical protein